MARKEPDAPSGSKFGRRDGLFGLAAAVGSMLAPSRGRAQTPAVPSSLTDTNVADGFRLALSGDLLVSRSVPATPQLQPVTELIQGADVAIANLEVPIIDLRQGRVQPASSGTALLTSSPDVAAYLKQTGFHMVGLANNHSLDWGVEGARETLRHLGRAGINAAGFGESRSIARAPTFVTTAKGRVGLISFTATFAPGWAASDPLGMVPGVAGVSALRTVRTEIVTKEQFSVLREIESQHNVFETVAPPPTGDNLTFRGIRFRPGDMPGIAYDMNPDDQADILRNIRQAKQQCDFLVVSMHNHEQPGCTDMIASGDGSAWRCQKPVEFMQKIARLAVDSGADVFMAHGPHVLLGVEIYRARPIFYSLGNLYAQYEATTQLRDAYPAAMNGKDVTLQEFSDTFWKYYEQDSTMYESIVAVPTFMGNNLASISLHPLDLGKQRRQADRGTPQLASQRVSDRIIGRLQEMSRPYGTQIVSSEGVGVITLSG